MKRMRLRTLMLVVLAIALMLGLGIGLRRRSSRFDRLSFAQSREASRLENQLMKVPEPADVDQILRRVHWHDTVAARYRQLAGRPWLLSEPDPATVACECSTCRGRYPGGGRD
jgi:hypothetical protein